MYQLNVLLDLPRELRVKVFVEALCMGCIDINICVFVNKYVIDLV